jgi:hypothetical protein
MEARKVYQYLDKKFELDRLQEDEWSVFDFVKIIRANTENRD